MNRQRDSRKGGISPLFRVVCLVLFLLYLCFVVFITGLTDLPRDILENSFTIRPNEINLIPFQTEGFSLRMDRWNVELFVPLGIFLPTLFFRLRKISCTALAGFLCSLTIELLQLFTSRVTDIDDLLMNILGAVVGYLIYKLLSSIRDFHSSSLR